MGVGSTLPAQIGVPFRGPGRGGMPSTGSPPTGVPSSKEIKRKGGGREEGGGESQFLAQIKLFRPRGTGEMNPRPRFTPIGFHSQPEPLESNLCFITFWFWYTFWREVPRFLFEEPGNGPE